MLKLMFLLSISLYAVMQIGGRDHGQLRPGLLAARETALNPAPAKTPPPAPVPVAAAYTPPAQAPNLPLVLPLVRADAPVVTATVIPADQPAPTPEGESEVRYVIARSVNVREGPSTDYPVVGRLTRGEAALVLWTEDNGWSHISIEGDGIAGYVSGDYLSAEAP